MTGITKFNHTGIFSAFNALKDISTLPSYGTIIGYTESEIRKYFAPYIQNAADVLHITQAELLQSIKYHYDGYSFNQNISNNIYSPWSVLNFLDNPEIGFQNYWFDSAGQPTVLLRYLKNHALQSPAEYGKSILFSISNLNTPSQYNEFSVEALLVQTGYLTIKSYEGGDFVRLGYPNQEVALSMARLYANALIRQNRYQDSGVAHLDRLLSTGSPTEVVSAFNRALDSIDYHRYPVRDEASCRAYLQVLLLGAALVPRVEVHNALGRSDMEVESGDRHWVFEFKYAQRKSDIPSLLEKSVAQIEANRYGDGRAEHKKLVRVALVFSAEDRAFTDYRSLDDL